MIFVHNLESCIFYRLDALASATDVRQATAKLNFCLDVPMFSVVWIELISQAQFI